MRAMAKKVMRRRYPQQEQRMTRETVLADGTNSKRPTCIREPPDDELTKYMIAETYQTVNPYNYLRGEENPGNFAENGGAGGRRPPVPHAAQRRKCTRRNRKQDPHPNLLLASLGRHPTFEDGAQAPQIEWITDHMEELD